MPEFSPDRGMVFIDSLYQSATSKWSSNLSRVSVHTRNSKSRVVGSHTGRESRATPNWYCPSLIWCNSKRIFVYIFSSMTLGVPIIQSLICSLLPLSAVPSHRLYVERGSATALRAQARRVVSVATCHGVTRCMVCM